MEHDLNCIVQHLVHHLEDEVPFQYVYCIVAISRGLLFYDLARFVVRLFGLEIMKSWIQILKFQKNLITFTFSGVGVHILEVLSCIEKRTLLKHKIFTRRPTTCCNTVSNSNILPHFFVSLPTQIILFVGITVILSQLLVLCITDDKMEINFLLPKYKLSKGKNFSLLCSLLIPQHISQ